MLRTNDPRWHVRWASRIVVILACWAVVALVITLVVWSLSRR